MCETAFTDIMFVTVQNGNLQDNEKLVPASSEYGVFFCGQQDHHLRHHLCLCADGKQVVC